MNKIEFKKRLKSHSLIKVYNAEKHPFICYDWMGIVVIELETFMYQGF